MKSPRRADEGKGLAYVEGILLDLGGTLIYGPCIKEVFARSLQSNFLDFELNEYLKRRLINTFDRVYEGLKVIKRKLLIEVSLYSMLKIALEKILKADTKLIEKLRDCLLGLYIETRSAYDDAHFFLEKLRALGYKIMIVSNVSDHYMALGSLEKLRLISYIDGVLTSAQLGVRKPHPLMYITAMKKLSTSNVVFIGNDIEADVLGPLRVGVPVIHVVREGARLKRSVGSLFNALDIILTQLV